MLKLFQNKSRVVEFSFVFDAKPLVYEEVLFLKNFAVSWKSFNFAVENTQRQVAMLRNTSLLKHKNNL